MISASLSLSLPRLGWKSTSTPRSLKICTAAGERASEMRTLGLVMGAIPDEDWFQIVTRGLDPRVHLPGWMAGSSPAMTRNDDETDQAALGSAALVSAKAQSIHCVNSSTSFASTVAPHQMRRPAGASR